MVRTSRAAAALLAAAAVASCGGGSDGGAPPAARATIDAAGGSLTSRDGLFTLTVPAGALGNATEIVITELVGSAIPEDLRSTKGEKVYRLEPSGTRFAVPARAVVRLPLGQPGDVVGLALVSNDRVAEMPPGQSIDELEDALVLEADIPHFSYALINRWNAVAGRLTPSQTEAGVGESIRFDIVVSGTSEESLTFTMDGATGPSYEGPMRTVDLGEDPPHKDFIRGIYGETRGYFTAICTAAGSVVAEFGYVMYSDIAAAFSFPYLFGLGQEEANTSKTIQARVRCTARQGYVIDWTLRDLAGVTAPDGITVSAAPFAGLAASGPVATVAGSNGAKVFDLATGQPILDRTATGPDGATVGTSLLGAVPVAASASASAPAALFGFGSAQGAQQGWTLANGWGGTFLEPRGYFDVVTAGGGTVTSTVVKVAAAIGLYFNEYDAAFGAFRASLRFAPLTSFVGARELTSAQMPEEGGGVLALSRDLVTSTGSKVYHQPFDTTQPATVLYSFARNDGRRLRCAHVGTKHVCAATMFDGAEVKAFAFDPAAPTAAPPAVTLPVGTGALGVAVAQRPNGNAAIVVTNFTANSINVIETTADLATVVSNSTVAAPAGCTAPGHPAWVTDSIGLVAIYTCNGTAKVAAHRPFN